MSLFSITLFLHYLLSAQFAHGAMVTLGLSLASLALGVVIGLMRSGILGVGRGHLPDTDRTRAVASPPGRYFVHRPPGGAMTEILNAAAIWKRFGDSDVLRGVDLSVREGECLVVLGPSGSGKSTLLRCINLLEPVSSGSILFQGQEISDLPRGQASLVRQRIGMVFQNFELFAHLTALDNIMLAPMKVRRLPRQQARVQALDLLARVHLPDKANAYPDELSGGQQQRVAIARALAMEPSLMLFDEPTSALDPETVGEVLVVMRELAEAGMTSIVVTHELGFARRAANEVMFMDHGVVAHRASAVDFFSSVVPERVDRFLSRMEA